MRHHLSLLVIAVAAGGGAVYHAGHGTTARAATAHERVGAPGRMAGVCVPRTTYEPLFRRAAAATGVPETLLLAIAEQESRLDVEARSPASARGLMQVMPDTAAGLHLHAERPNENVLAGALYLREMLRRFDSLDLALAAYNAGPAIVARLHRAPNTAVIGYVQNVTSRWVSLSACSDGVRIR